MQEAISTTVTDVRLGQRIIFNYPTGRKASDYQNIGHVLVLPDGSQLRQDNDLFFVAYGPTTIVVTYGLGEQQGAGVVTLFSPLVIAVSPVVLTQTQYDAIAAPDEGTLYLIPDEA